MRRRVGAILVAATVAALGFLLPGCEGDQGPQGEIGPTGPTGPQGEPGEITPFITGIIRAPFFSMGAHQIYGTADINISKIPSLPVVRVNNFNIGQRLSGTGEGLTFYSNSLSVGPGDPATLTVDYLSASGDSMQASAGITIPQDFTVTPDFIVATQNDTVRLDWTPSAGADGYYIIIATQVEYMDTLGIYYRHSFELDTIVADTFFEMAAAPFFPEGIDPGLYLGPQYMISYVRLSAVSGPVFAEDSQNITGDGYGFVYGENLSPEIVLDLAVPAKFPGEAAAPDVAGRLLDHLVRLHSR